MTTRSLAEPRHPDTRETRTLELYRTRGREIVLVYADTYEVPSCSGGAPYVVDLREESCSCKDFEVRQENCKHILAAAVKRAKKRGATVPRLPDHELIRLDAAAHPERTYSEHEAAARTIVGRTYVEDLRRISTAAQATLSRELEAEDLGL